MRTNVDGVVAAVALFGTITLSSPEVTDYSIRCQPVAELTSALRSDCLSTTSVARATQDRPPGVSSAAFRAQSPDLRFASLMDMDFAVSRPLVRRSRLIPGFCPSTRTFASRFLQTPPRDDSPCVWLTLPGRPGEFHPEPPTDPDVNLSIHPARATQRRLPPSIKTRSSSGFPLTPS
jgi:hypothetical protein